MIPKTIQESHVLQAIEKIDAEGIVYPLTKSKKYDLVYNSKTYPPKLVISLAHEFANGEYLTHKKFNTYEAQHYLQELSTNFVISEKGPNVVDNIMDRYKKLLVEIGIDDELYKWKLVKRLKGRPTVDASDFATEIKEVVSPTENNMLYQMAKATANRIATQKPEEYRACFQKLYDETIPLQQRINSFQSETLVLYKNTEGQHSAHHDERTISVFLTFHNPDKYTFYKSSYYEEYCKVLGIKPKYAGEKYVHYLELIQDLADNYIQEDKELLALADSKLTDVECYEDENRLLLAQDVLYTLFNKLKLIDQTNFKEVIKEVERLLEKEELNPFDFGKRTNGFVWIKDKHGLIGNLIVHYEISIDKVHGKYTVDIHFEGKEKNDRTQFNQIIENLPNELKAITWQGSKSIRYGNGIDINDPHLLNKLVEELLFLEDALGDMIRNVLTQNSNTKKSPVIMNSALNQILFGPPGTGKTYNTVNESLKIVDPEFYAENIENRKALTERFKELLIKDWANPKGQIAFCTFHQSFSYEDFVEGIKPKTTDDKRVYYETECGVFKNICLLGDSNKSTIKVIKEGKMSWDAATFSRASFYKISLGEAFNPADRIIYEYCRDNGFITIGFVQGHDFTGMSESQIQDKCKELGLNGIEAQQLIYFIHYLKKGNYVLVSNGNKYVRAIGKVTGDYEYNENAPFVYNHFRKIEWIFKDENIPVEEIYDRQFSQKTLYKIDQNSLNQNFFVNKGREESIEEKEKKKYVIIIDEINRGNVSSIFGELITLIEKDKRSGGKEELEVTLPYSKTPFKVPENVFIIGTMNTADRSIEALDTALRRRFSFKEMPPKPELIKSKGASLELSGGKIDTVDVVKLLETINTRIEKLIDKDHKIGHSYFMHISTPADLIKAFEDKVIPLLEEYFFGDFGKIGLVLGNSFVQKEESDEFEFANFDGYTNQVQDLKERPVFKIRPSNEWNFTSIYELTK